MQKMLNNLSDNAEKAQILGDKFGIDTTGQIDSQLQGLKDQMMAWYAHGGKAEVARHLVMRVIASEHDNHVTGLSKVVGSFDDSGHLHLPANYAHAAYKEIALVDDSGHYHILATEKTGTEMLHDGVATAGKPGQIDFRSPVPHGVEEPWTLAGSKRETDKDVEKQKLKDEEKRKKEEEKNKQKEAEKAGHGEKEKVEVQAAGSERALQEVTKKLDEKEFDLKSFNEFAEKFGIDKEALAIMALEAKGVDYKTHEAEAMKAAKERGIAEPTKLELYLLMLAAVQQGYDFGQNKPKEGSNEKEDVVYDEEAEVKKADREEVFGKPPAEKKGKEKGQKKETAKEKLDDLKTKVAERRAGKEKPKDSKKDKVVEMKKEQLEKGARNEAMLRNFSREYGIPGIRLRSSEAFRAEFDKKSPDAVKIALDKLADALRNVRKQMKGRLPSPLNLEVGTGGSKVGTHPDRSNTYYIPFNAVAEQIAPSLVTLLRAEAGSKKKVKEAA